MLLQGFVVDEDPIESSKKLIKLKSVYTELSEIYDKVYNSDIVIINGEGSMIFSTPPRKDLLFQLMIIELACLLKKRVFYINAMVSNCPLTGRNDDVFSVSINALKKCNCVSVRDKTSFDILHQYIKNLSFIPDALFTWVDLIVKKEMPQDSDLIIPHPELNCLLNSLNFCEPYICVSGSSLVPTNVDEAIKSYYLLITRLKALGLRIYLVATAPGDSFLHDVGRFTGVNVIPENTNIFVGAKILSNACLFISGRYHPSILASLGGTPCIFLDSNSHKTTSLQRTLCYDSVSVFSPFLSEDDINTVLQKSNEILEKQLFIRKKIKRTVKELSNKAKKVNAFIKETL